MKRPQGFDPAPALSPQRKITQKPAQRSASVTPITAPTAKPERARPAARELRRAKRERRSYEKGEVRRFTRRTRSRRRLVVSLVAVAATFVTLIAVAVWSPLLALKQITIVGANRVDAAAVHEAIDGQLGTPLALVDLGRLTDELAAFPLIRSYTTESVPPHTLVVTIVERQPVGLVSDGSQFAVVDPAGVVIESVATRPPGLPVIAAGDASIGNPAFAAAVEVLLALPPALLAQVDTISATTNDDVAFVLTGDVQSVTWGSVDRSEFKARVLATLLTTQAPTTRSEFDVSAPDAPVVRSR
jgi:cell division protein FtsQ